MLSTAVQVQIGRLLRDITDDVVAEPLPQRFVDLLAGLDAKKTGR